MNQNGFLCGGGFGGLGANVPKIDLQQVGFTEWLPKQADYKFQLPLLIKKSVEPARFFDCDVAFSDEYGVLEGQQEEILEKLKNSLTAAQYERLESWIGMVEHQMTHADKGSYELGVAYGIRLSKQIESV